MVSRLVYVPKGSQVGFYNSVARYPGYIASWGAGKTLCAIMKGLALSTMYVDNEGLVTRRRFNTLMKTTVKDFTDWTGIRVSESKQYAEVPGVGSRVNFVHSDDLVAFREAMQGMNLGWAYIEQADEHEDGSIFDELRGRVRRILTPNAMIQDKLIELGVMKERVEDFKLLDSGYRQEIEAAIVEKLHLPVRQIFVVANAKGHNWVYDRWHPKSKKGRIFGDSYEGVIGFPGENKEYIPRSTLEDWERMKLENPRKYARCVLNSFEDYELEGSFYSDLMSDALKDGRVELEELYDNTIPVYTFWDLGVGNATVIWFVQFVGQSIRLIDYYEDSGHGMSFLSGVLDGKGYGYAEHWLPHDARQRLQGRVVSTRLDILRSLRRTESVRILPRHSIEDRIQAARSVLPQCRFSVKCERGVECLNKYHREINRQKSTEETTVYLDVPAKEYSDGADGFGYLAVGYRHIITDSVTGRILGCSEGPADRSAGGPGRKYSPLRYFTEMDGKHIYSGVCR